MFFEEREREEREMAGSFAINRKLRKTATLTFIRTRSFSPN